MEKVTSPVFIIGGSRTGSEMLKTMLSASPQLDFVDELFLYCPRWLHTDLATNIHKHVGQLNDPGANRKLSDLLFSGVPYGWFWQNVDSQLDRQMLEHELADKKLNMRELFSSIMYVHSRRNKKTGFGAKFPMHYSYTDKLLEWYPDCKLIHTTRNPKAVYASQAAKYQQKALTAVRKRFLRFQHFVHINIQTAWTAHIHKKFAGLENYTLVRYEDTVLKPRQQILDLCEFLGVDFLENMLEPKQYGSSFEKIKNNKGVSRSSLERYRDDTSKFTQTLMDIIHSRAYRRLGYDR